jgi:ribosomal protein S12 methylthiotransferase
MEKSRAISAARLKERIGTRMRVLVDRVDEGIAIARSTADAPEIDGVVRVARARELTVGDWAQVEITGADDYDLNARALQ